MRDTGIGISADMLPRVFDLFAQADCSLDRSRGGLGIGLTLVKSLVSMHGGTIHASSAGLGQGCEVVVRLPVLSTEPHDSESRPVEPERVQEVLRHVLVVDDNRASADSLSLLLELSGHDSRVAYSGPEARRGREPVPPGCRAARHRTARHGRFRGRPAAPGGTRITTGWSCWP